MPPADARQIVMESAWAKGLRKQAGGVATVLTDAGTEFITVGQGATPETPMEMGSVTKAFTGLLLADMVERGEANLQMGVDEAVFGERWAGEPAITLEELATHTSGLPRLSFSASIGLLGNPYRWFGTNHLLRYLRRVKPRRPAEPTFRYSNLGFAVLGLAMARRAEMPYEELLRERLLKPLGLQQTQLQMVGEPNLVAGGYHLFGRRARPWHFKAYAPCGALVSTAEDMLRAAGSFCAGSGPLASGVQMAIAPRLAATVGRVGLAWITPLERDWAWHNGGTFGYQAYVAFSVRKRVAVVLLANQYGAQPMTVLGHKLMRALME